MKSFRYSTTELGFEGPAYRPMMITMHPGISLIFAKIGHNSIFELQKRGSPLMLTRRVRVSTEGDEML